MNNNNTFYKGFFLNIFFIISIKSQEYFNPIGFDIDVLQERQTIVNKLNLLYEYSNNIDNNDHSWLKRHLFRKKIKKYLLKLNHIDDLLNQM